MSKNKCPHCGKQILTEGERILEAAMKHGRRFKDWATEMKKVEVPNVKKQNSK
jgi:endogenous inhibitor of DNA gyrase (YacG/DUF329 family)